MSLRLSIRPGPVRHIDMNTEHPYRWTIVAVGALMTCVALGAMFSLAIFLDPVSRDMGWSRAGISVAMTINFLVMGAGAFAWGALSDRYGTRVVVSIGAVLLGLALVLTSRVQSLLLFQLTYGILVGLAASTFFAPMIALTTGWFDKQRSLAVSLVSAGMGVAPMTISPFARWLITTYDWRTAMFVIGILAWVLLIPAAMLVRQPPAASAAGPQASAGPDASIATVAEALRSRQFIVLAVVFFLCCAAHSGPIFHMVSYAMACGIAPMAAVTIYSVEGLAGLGGRLVFGVAGDRYGAKRVLIVGLLIQALAIGAYPFVRELGEFYFMAVIFGTAYGGVMPLYAVLARDYFSQSIMGTVFGAATMLSSLGMSAGPVVGGWIFDRYGGYSWLFFASLGLAVGAMAIAFSFPRTTTQPQLQPA
jgi:MFS family permease